MRRSLRLRQFLIIAMATLLVVLTSRWYAQKRASDEFRHDLHSDIQVSLMSCAHVAERKDAWPTCNARTFKNYLFNKLSGEVTLCHDGKAMGDLGDESNCILLNQTPHFWSAADVSTEPAVQLVVNTLGGELWHIARLKAHPEIQIMTNDAALQRLLKALFKIRDQQLPIFAPILVLCALLLALYVTHLTISPLEKLKLALSTLKPENLNNAERISTPFREFDGFITVYHQLLKRLGDSFTKAKRFSSDAAHELRTPLAILRGQVEDLIGDVPTGSPLQVRLRSMADEIERLIEISEKLLLLSKADAQLIEQELSDFDLSAFLDELVEESDLYHPNVRIEKSIQPHVIWRCDPSLIRQLIHNLYANAVNYNRPDGWIKFTLKSDGHMLELAIENPSENIPSDLKEKAFDRFYRGDFARTRKVGGAGLGLSICHEIAILHQGSLSLEPTLSQSVIVTLRTPLN